MQGTIATPVERVFLLATLARPEGGELAVLAHLATEVSWEGVWALADANGVAPLVIRTLAGAGLVSSMPASVRARFEGRAMLARREAAARLVAAAPVLERLAARRVPVAVLKGAYLAETVYGEPGYKRMNDLDLLIRPVDLAAAYAVYDACGLRYVGGRGVDGRRRADASHHAAAHATPDLACVIDTQWALAPPRRRYALDGDRIWSRTVELSLAGVRLRTLGVEDHLHHLCLHRDDLEAGAGALADVYNLVRRHRAGLRWSLFLDEVTRAGSEVCVYATLGLAQRLCPLPEVEDVVRWLEPSVPHRQRRLLRRRTAWLAWQLRLATPGVAGLQRRAAALHLATSSAARQRAFVGLWRAILAPPSADALRLAARPEARGVARMRARAAAPGRILRALAADLGARRLLAMALGTAVAVVRPARPRASEHGSVHDGSGASDPARAGQALSSDDLRCLVGRRVADRAP